MLAESSSLPKIDSDYLLRNEWWPAALDLPHVWSSVTGLGVTIASCDSGYYTDARDLNSNLVLKYARDFSSYQPKNVSDGAFVSQGTASAAIMVGVKNFDGVNGIAYNAKLVPLQNFHYSKQLDKISLEIATAKCISYAITVPNVSIIVVQAVFDNNTIDSSPIVKAAVRHAIKSGVAVIAPAGDGSKKLPSDKEYDSGAILVGAVTQEAGTAVFSNFGSRVTISAYGEKIKTLWGRYGETQYFGGTVAASAQVAGIVALAKEIQPNLQPEDIKWLLKTTRVRTPKNYNVGGLIQVKKFLEVIENYDIDYSKVKAARQYRAIISRRIKQTSWAK
jgi:subtilisin family serine protease